ncbi:MAG: ABC transporter ATP-binding protein [Propionibacteriaceae bacterium]
MKVYGSGDNIVYAVNGVDVAFERGSFTAIMGPSGSGKSTLMHCLAGLDQASSGHITLGNSEITAMKDKQLTKVRRDKIGFIFQAFNLLPTLTAKQNILLPLELAGRKPDHAHIDALAESLGLSDRLHHRPSELSGGQQQRVAIARALASKPDVIFADEPTGALDSRNGLMLLRYLKKCSAEDGQTIVMVTHDPLAASFAERVLMLSDGRIIRDLDNPTQDQIMAEMKALTEAIA